MIFFPNCEIEIYKPSELVETNPYTGEPMDSWDLVGTFEADIQQNNNVESQDEWGKELKDQFDIYVDLSVPVDDTCIIKVVGSDKTYDIVGTPQVWNHFLNFIKIVVQEHRQKLL